MTELALLVAYASKLVGAPYIFGAQHPSVGYDCSGLASEILIAGGALPHHTDLSAQGIFEHFLDDQPSQEAECGSLVFFGKSVTSISHVGWAITPYMMIEAAGGDSTTISVEQAILRGAFVRVRPIGYRKDFVGAIRPKYGWEK